MIVLDFGSGPRENVETLWTPGYGIEALQKSVAGEIGKLTVHAFDPLEIEKRSGSQNRETEIQLHNSFKTLPDNCDVVCVLHPNPGVLYSHRSSHDDWNFQHGRYMSLLVHAIEEKLTLRGRVILQFDDELEKLGPGKGAEKFIGIIKDGFGYRLEELTTTTEMQFPRGVYNFSSFHVLEKRVS